MVNTLPRQLQEGASQIALKQDFKDPDFVDIVLGVIKDLTGLDLYGLWEGVESLVDGVRSVLNQLLDIINGLIVTPINAAVAAVQDFFAGLFGFQEDVPLQISDLQNRAQILEGIIGYGSFVMPVNRFLGLTQNTDTRRLPFTYQIGPSVGVVSNTNGSLTLGSRGLWTVYSSVRARSTIYTGGDRVWLDLVVTDPAGNVLRKKEIDFWSYDTSIGLQNSLTVVTPTAGCIVHAYVRSDRWRWFLGGSDFSELTVLKHSNEVENTGGVNPGDPGDEGPPGQT